MADAYKKSLSRLFGEAARLHRNRAAQLLAELGLHPGQEKLLKSLVAQEGRTMGELAAELGVQAPTVSKMIARLATTGLVERRTGGGDGRQARAFLTAEGRDRATQVTAIFRSLERQSFAGFGSKDRKRLKKLLRRVRDNLAPADTAASPRGRPTENAETEPADAVLGPERPSRLIRGGA